MASHGGYAAVLSLRQQVLQDYLTIAYGTEKFGRIVTNIFGSGPVKVLLFLVAPQIECRASDNGLVRIRIRAVGDITVGSNSAEEERRSVTTDSTVLVAPVVGWHEPVPGERRFGLHFSDARTESFAITPVRGGPFSPTAQTILGNFVPGAAAEAVLGLLSYVDLRAVIDPSVFGGVASAISAAGTTIITDGEIAFAVDVAEENSTGTSMVTTGDPRALPRMPAGTDIAFTVNPIATPLVFSQVETALRLAAEDEGASLGLYNLEMRDGAFAVRGRLSKSSGLVDFSFRAVPQLIRPGVVTRYEENGRTVVERELDAEVLWFKAEDVQADASLSWWAAFAAVVLPPVGVPIAFALLNGREEDLREAIRSGRNELPRVRRFMLGDGASPIVTTKLEQFECRGDEVFVATTFSHSSFPPGRIEGPASLGVEEVVALPPTFRFDLPFSVFGDRHTVALWSVIDAETLADLARARIPSIQDVLPFPLPASFTLPADLPYLSEPTLLVSVRVVRELGAVTEQLFSSTMTLKVRDFLDRSHPYFRWRHEVRVPSVRVEADGVRTIQGYPLRRRISKIHRTAIPGRCRMIYRMSLNRVTRPEPVPPVVGIEYLDTLPFAREELDQRRSEVCEYCFYGGPGRTRPLID